MSHAADSASPRCGQASADRRPHRRHLPVVEGVGLPGRPMVGHPRPRQGRSLPLASLRDGLRPPLTRRGVPGLGVGPQPGSPHPGGGDANDLGASSRARTCGHRERSLDRRDATAVGLRPERTDRSGGRRARSGGRSAHTPPPAAARCAPAATAPVARPAGWPSLGPARTAPARRSSRSAGSSRPGPRGRAGSGVAGSGSGRARRRTGSPGRSSRWPCRTVTTSC